MGGWGLHAISSTFTHIYLYPMKYNSIHLVLISDRESWQSDIRLTGGGGSLGGGAGVGCCTVLMSMLSLTCLCT